ncbi:MAG: hypothetical protein VX341_09415 [Bdellovibrionota bacterium]|nr:hypothetical protein [Bdellovibrionota bacterium]
MRSCLLMIFFVSSLSSYAGSTQETVEAIKGLKLNDHHGRKIASEQDFKGAFDGISPEKLKEVQEQLQKYQKQQKEQQKYLEELMNE